MSRRISLYAGKGAGDFSLYAAQLYFRGRGHDVRLVQAEAVISGDAFAPCDLFIMPGGADLPYCAALNGAGNRNIRAFVENGGTYLGLCAGAYYGCRAIAYHEGRADEIAGARELALIGALGYGSLPELAGYYDTHLRTAATARLILPDGQEAVSHYHGGCAFALDDPDAHILARYAELDGQPPAVIAKQAGRGRAILSGVHCEVTPASLTGWAGWDDAGEAALAARLAETLASGAPLSLWSRLEQ